MNLKKTDDPFYFIIFFILRQFHLCATLALVAVSPPVPVCLEIRACTTYLSACATMPSCNSLIFKIIINF